MLLDVPDDLWTSDMLSCWVVDIFIPVLELCSEKQLRCWGTVWSFQVLLFDLLGPEPCSGYILTPH